MPQDPSADQQKTSTEEQSKDQAGSDPTGVQETETTEERVETESTEETEETTEESIELLGKDRFEALKNDPVALSKELNKAATTKFQELAKERKSLKPYSEFIAALDENPQAAVTALAKSLGLKIGPT